MDIVERLTAMVEGGWFTDGEKDALYEITKLRAELAEAKKDAERFLAAILNYGKAVKLHESRVRDPNFNWDDLEAVDYIDHELVIAGLELEAIAGKEQPCTTNE